MNDAFNQKLKYLKIHSKNLFLVADFEMSSSVDSFLNEIASACLSGIQVLLYRDNKSSDREYISNAKKIKLLCEEFGVTFLVNNRPDIAFVIQSDGVLLGQNDIDILSARDILVSNSIIGIACHNLSQVDIAISQQADFAIIYDSDSLDKHALSSVNIKSFIYTDINDIDNIYSYKLLPVLNFDLIKSDVFCNIKSRLLNKL